MSELKAQTGAVQRVAYRIGRVVAQRALVEDRAFARLDALGRSAAIHTMATNMTDSLLEEAAAAYAESVKIVREDQAEAVTDA